MEQCQECSENFAAVIKQRGSTTTLVCGVRKPVLTLEENTAVSWFFSTASRTMNKQSLLYGSSSNGGIAQVFPS